jgi:hypothetical protein
MKVEFIKNIEGKLLFLDFGKINYIKTEFDIELIFIKLKRVYETISSITVLDDITEKIIVVKASYGAMAYFKKLDIYENGEKIGKIRHFYTPSTLFLTKDNTKFYKVGDSLPFRIKDENRLLKILLNQNFACFTQTYKKNIKSDEKEKPEVITNFYIIPCTEIYMKYFGQYDRAIIDSTFTGEPKVLYNDTHTEEYRISYGDKDFIKLSKYFQHDNTLAPYIVYRLYEDENFSTIYNNSRSHIIGKEEYFYSEFPLESKNNIMIDYLKIDENIFYCTKIKSIESNYQYPDPLNYDIENAQGTFTAPNTIKVAGIKTIKPLPHITGTNVNVEIVNEPRNPSAIKKVEVENDEFVNLDFTSKLVKILKHEKKTTNTDSSVILPPSTSLTIQHGSSSLSNSAQVSTAVKNPNIPDEKVKEIILEDLEQIRLNFSQRPEITDLKYYLGRTSHSIKYINSDENKGKISKWIYINNGSGSVRNFGILEMKYKGKKYYVLDVQKREAIKDAKQVKEGICLFSFFFTDENYYLDSIKFDAIKKIIVSEKGIFTSVLKKLLTSPVSSNFPIKGGSFIHSSLSADKIFSKIQEWGKTNY